MINEYAAVGGLTPAGKTVGLAENLPQYNFLHNKSHLTTGFKPGPPGWKGRRITSYSMQFGNHDYKNYNKCYVFIN
jgi:hypothetical protein